MYQRLQEMLNANADKSSEAGVQRYAGQRCRVSTMQGPYVRSRMGMNVHCDAQGGQVPGDCRAVLMHKAQ